MGLHDRQYMKRRRDPPPGPAQVKIKPVIPKPTHRASLWKRLLFRIWLLFHRGK